MNKTVISRGLPDATLYTISDARYFLGTVGLLNSLRLTGNPQPLVILDCGFTDPQRALLRPHCTLRPFPREQAINPTLFKPHAYLDNPSNVVVILDSDMVVTRPLGAVLEGAAAGAICAFPDPDAGRWFAEWEQLFLLSQPPRRQVYVNAGFVAFSAVFWPGLLARWWQLCQRIWSHPTRAERVTDDNPSAQGDQDALNALLMSEIPSGALQLLRECEAPTDGELRAHRGVTVVDERALAVQYRGCRTQLLHSSGKDKPWIADDWMFVQRTAYLRLLVRLLTAPDVPLRVPQHWLPIWLHPSVAGESSSYVLDAVARSALAINKRVRFVRPVLHALRRARHPSLQTPAD